MARRRYQEGCLFVRPKRKEGKKKSEKKGRKVKKVWVGRWREDVIQPDGTLGRVLRSEVLGLVSELSKREARKLLEIRLGPINQGWHRPQSTIRFATFVREQFEPLVLPTLKFSTQQVYRVLLNKHLTPAFGDRRLCDIGRADVQRFVLDKLKQG